MLVTTRQDKYIDLAYRFLLPLVHSKFSSDKGLLTIAKKSSNPYLTVGENHKTEKNKLQPTLQFLPHICDIFARSKFVLETLVKAKPQRKTSEGQSDLSLTWISKIFNTKFAPRNLV